MKNTLLKFIAITLLFFVSLNSCTSSKSSVSSKKEVLLRQKPVEGAIYDVKMDITMNMDGDQAMVMKMGFEMDNKIGKINLDKSYFSTSSIKKIKMMIDMGNVVIDYDSDSKEMDALSENMHKTMSKMIGIGLKSKYSERGVLLESPNLQELFDDPKIKEQMSESSDMMSNSKIEFPEKAVKRGSTWKNEVVKKGKTPMKMMTTYKVASISSKFVTLSMKGTIDYLENETLTGSGTQVGTLIINRKDGFATEMTMKQTIEMVSFGKTMNIVNDISLISKKK